MKKLFFIFFGIIIYTQIGCAFVSTTIGSFLGNLGAGMVMEEKEKDQKDSTKKSPGKKL